MIFDNRENKQQLILQETIEAFTIIAIGYNSRSLINALLDSLKAQGVNINMPLLVSISIQITLTAAF